MSKCLVEVCCGSYQDALNARQGGALRIELNSALALGGLTPSLGVFRQARKIKDLQIIAMVRPRGAGFCYDESTHQVMLAEAKILLDEGADGIAFGYLNRDLTINIAFTKAMVNLIHSYQKTAVFHRAFDVCIDPYQSIQKLIELDVDRILSSGQKATALEGNDLIKDLLQEYHGQIEILAGSGITAENACTFIRQSGVEQVHSSCKGYVKDESTINKDVTYAYLKQPNELCYDEVSANKVRALIAAIEKDQTI